MTRLLILTVSFFALVCQAQTNISVIYSFMNGLGQVQNVKQVSFTPMAYQVGSYSNATVVGDEVFRVVTASRLTNNMLSGFAYRVKYFQSIQPPVTTFIGTNYFGTNVTGAVYATDYMAPFGAALPFLKTVSTSNSATATWSGNGTAASPLSVAVTGSGSGSGLNAAQSNLLTMVITNYVATNAAVASFDTNTGTMFYPTNYEAIGVAATKAQQATNDFGRTVAISMTNAANTFAGTFTGNATLNGKFTNSAGTAMIGIQSGNVQMGNPGTGNYPLNYDGFTADWYGFFHGTNDYSKTVSQTNFNVQLVQNGVVTNGSITANAALNTERWLKYSCPLPIRSFNPFYGQYGSTITQTNWLTVLTNYQNAGMLSAGYTYFMTDAGWAITNQPSDDLIVARTNLYPLGVAWTASTLASNGITLGLWVSSPNTVGAFGGSLGQMGIAGFGGTNLSVMQSNLTTIANWGINYIKFDGIGNYIPTPYGAWPYSTPNLYGYGWLIQGVWQSLGKKLIITGAQGLTALPIGGLTPEALTSVNVMRCQYDTASLYWFKTNLDQILPYLPSLVQAGTFPTLDDIAPWSGDPNGVGVNQFPQQRLCLAADALLPSCTTVHNDSFASASGQFINGDTMPGQFYYTNSEVLAIQRDPALYVGQRISVGSGSHTNRSEVWSRKLSDGTYVVGLMNWSMGAATNRNITANLTDCGVPRGISTVRDVFAQSFIGYCTNDTITATVVSNDVALYRIYPGSYNPFKIGTNWFTGMEYNALTFSNSVALGSPAQAADGYLTYSGYWKPFANTNTYNNAPNIIAGNSVTYTNCLLTRANGGLNYWLGGKMSQIGFTLGLNKNTDFGQNATTTNLVNIYADGSLIFTSLVSSNTALTTNLNVVGVQNLKVETLQSSWVTNSVNAVLVDFANFYAYQPATATQFGGTYYAELATNVVSTNLPSGSFPLVLTVIENGRYRLSGSIKTQGLAAADKPNFYLVCTSSVSAGYVSSGRVVWLDQNAASGLGKSESGNSSSYYAINSTGDGFNRILAGDNYTSSNLQGPQFEPDMMFYVTNAPAKFFIRVYDGNDATHTNTVFQGTWMMAEQKGVWP